MIHSEEFRTLVKRIFIFFLLIVVGSILFGYGSANLYKTSLQKEQAKVISVLVTKYPDLETDIIKAMLEDGNIEAGEELLAKYGLTLENMTLLDSQQIGTKIFLLSFSLGIVTLILVSACYLIHLRKIYQKLERINTYINEVLNDRFPLNLKEYQEGTFSTLKNDIYKITNKLKDQKELLVKEKQYLEITLSDISHQLKTPLTSMYVLNNLLADDKLDTKIRAEFIRKNESQLERIEWLVSSLLKLSRLEGGMVQLKKESIRVSELLQKAIEPISIPIELKKQTVTVEGKKTLTLICDVHWTTEAFVNILKNAHEHTPIDGQITISYSENPIYVEVLIQDTGEGIDDEDLNHIFERFYKGSHNAKESIGIGLNMTKQILTRQNATIDVESTIGFGTTFIIHFFKNQI